MIQAMNAESTSVAKNEIAPTNSSRFTGGSLFGERFFKNAKRTVLAGGSGAPLIDVGVGYINGRDCDGYDACEICEIDDGSTGGGIGERSSSIRWKPGRFGICAVSSGFDGGATGIGVGIAIGCMGCKGCIGGRAIGAGIAMRERSGERGAIGAATVGPSDGDDGRSGVLSLSSTGGGIVSWRPR